MPQLKDLIIKTEKVNWQELKDLQPSNLKTPYHSNLTKESLIKNGFAFSFYIWEDKDGSRYLVDGHLRTDLLRELKNEGFDIPDQLSCTFLDLPNRKTAVKYLLEVFNTKKNPIDETTMIDWIKDEDIDLEEVSLDWLDVSSMEGLEEEALEAKEDDFDPTPPEKPKTVLGDLYEIGEHRLLCGDSTDSDQVAKLMNGEKADMVFTDPPYGIDWNTDYTRFKGGLKPSENKYSKIQNDEKDFDPSFLLSMFGKCLFFGANCFSDKLPKGNWIVWDKRFENGEAFLADAEVAWYNGSGAVYIIKETHQGFVSSDKKRFHPTQKPVKLIEKVLDKINAPNFLFDPYSGSGSTMVASHQLNRRCYGMELDPKYCDVIVKRMIKLDPELTVKRNGIDVSKEFIT